MSGLKDLLNQPEPTPARRERATHPRGYEPGVRFDAGTPVEVTLTLPSIPDADEQKYREEIKRVTGLDVPEHRSVELSQVRFWGPPEEPMIYVRFSIADRVSAPIEVDGAKLLHDLRVTKRPRPRTSPEASGAFVVGLSDFQVGKREGGGTAAFLTRFEKALRGVEARLKEFRKLKRLPRDLLVLGLGDLLEGCDMFQNHAWEVDADRRTQVNVVVSCILELLDRLAPHFTDVTVVAVGGNHGENRIGFKRTTRHDNDDVAVFEHAARAVVRDSKLKHVNFVLSQSELSQTIEVQGWVLGVTHGQAYGKGSGGSIEAKVLKWYANQAAGRHPIGDADVLVTAHFHHLQVKDHGAWIWLQAPALDGGSAWYQDQSGMYAAPGMLTFVVTPEERVKDLQVIS